MRCPIGRRKDTACQDGVWDTLPLMPDSPLAPVLTPSGWELLNGLPAYDTIDPVALNLKLRQQGHAPETVAAALSQAELRARGRRKFAEFAASMLFTREGLEQATRLSVASLHAERFRRAGLTDVADLGCGLGGDSRALAALGLKVVAVDADETTAAVATMNLRTFPEAQVLHTTAEGFIAERTPLPEGWGIWLDPARRDLDKARSSQGRASRLWDPEAFSPPLSFVTELAATGVPLGVKLGPGIPHDLIPAGCEAEWISVDREVVEVVLWFNALARPGVRRAATVLTHTGPGAAGLSRCPESPARQESSAHGESPASPDPQASPEPTARRESAELTSSADFEDRHDEDRSSSKAPVSGVEGLVGILYEPDGAVIRAGLVSDLAAAAEGRLLDEHIAYFTADEELAPELRRLARGYAIREVMGFSVKRLRRWVQEEGVTSLEIKKRGVDVAPEQLRRELLGKKKAAKGTAVHQSLVLTRIGQQRVAVVVDPLP